MEAEMIAMEGDHQCEFIPCIDQGGSHPARKTTAAPKSLFGALDKR
jgi:hypothetical protein